MSERDRRRNKRKKKQALKVKRGEGTQVGLNIGAIIMNALTTGRYNVEIEKEKPQNND